MTCGEILMALAMVKAHYDSDEDSGERDMETKGGYYRVGNVVIKIAEITELP